MSLCHLHIMSERVIIKWYNNAKKSKSSGGGGGMCGHTQIGKNVNTSVMCIFLRSVYFCIKMWTKILDNDAKRNRQGVFYEPLMWELTTHRMSTFISLKRKTEIVKKFRLRIIHI